MAEQDALILGALLHDIGKFEFRANRDFTPHTNYGGYFVGEHLKQFRCLDDIREEIRRKSGMASLCSVSRSEFTNGRSRICWE